MKYKINFKAIYVLLYMINIIYIRCYLVIFSFTVLIVFYCLFLYCQTNITVGTVCLLKLMHYLFMFVISK